MDEQARFQKAKKRVEEIKGFYSHLSVYIVVNAGLFTINMLTSRESLWFYWPLIGWGIGIIAHATSVFGFFGFFGHEWERRKIQEIMDKEQEKGQGKP